MVLKSKLVFKQPKTMETQGIENHISAMDIGNSLCTQMTLRAAIELDVFNIIAKSGPGTHLSSKEIVSQIPTTNSISAAKNLERMLNLLSVHSFLSISLRPARNDNTLQEKTYGLTENSLCLVPNEDGVSLAPLMMFSSEMHNVQSLYLLKHTVLEPECTPFNKSHGETFFEYMSKKPEFIQLFDKAMRIFSYLYFDQVLEVYRGFQELKELMDVGGGDGSSIAKIVSRYPHIHGINFNLPSIIDQAPKYQGVKHVKGDMFKSIPKTQSIMLKCVLHNWDDEQCKKILRKCWEAIPKTGKVIVVEYFMIPEELIKNSPEMKNSLTSDIMMMTLTSGGKERTTACFDNLAKSVGFIETNIFPISHGTCVIEFLK